MIDLDNRRGDAGHALQHSGERKVEDIDGVPGIISLKSQASP